MFKTSMLRLSAKKITVLALSFVICLSFVLPVATYAVTQSDLDSANAKLEQLRREQAARSSEYARLNESLQTALNALADIDMQISAKQADIDKLQVELESLGDDIEEQYEAMKLRIQYMYEAQTSNLWSLILSSKSFSDMLTHAEYAVQLSLYDRSKLTQLETALSQKQDVSKQLQSDMQTLGALRNDAAAKAENIKKLLDEKQKEIDVSSASIKEVEELAIAYEKAIEEERIAQQEAERNQLNGGSYVPTNGSPISYDAKDLAMLAAIIECEAGNQPYEGLIAVGSVVINRIRDPRFANTLSGVLFSPGQFTPVASGRFAIVLARGATERCVQAAKEVLNGKININALYFHRYRPEKNEKGTIIGDHIFM